MPDAYVIDNSRCFTTEAHQLLEDSALLAVHKLTNKLLYLLKQVYDPKPQS